MSDFRTIFYNSYIDFKAWNQATPDTNEAFAIEVSRVAIPPQSQVLEIGFGQGAFLDWLKTQGHQTYGLEVIPELVGAAQKRGHQTICEPLQKLSTQSFVGTQFDLIIAFDVLEHLYVEEILQLMKWAHQALKPGGKILARFPNCASPWGLAYQNGDITHVTQLSAAKIGQVAAVTGFRSLSAQNSARMVKTGKRSPFVRRSLYSLRNFFQKFFGLLYFGQNQPMDPNLTVILQKQA